MEVATKQKLGSIELSRNVPELRFPSFNDEWNKNKLSNLTSYVDYRGRAPIKSERGYFLVTAKNIKKGFIDYECSKEFVSEENYLNVMSKGIPEVGDVLFTTEAPMGNVAQVNNKNIALAQRVIKFRGTDQLDNKYLLFYMLSSVFQKTISKKAIGTTVQGISGKELHRTPISFPSLSEQQKIASFLTKVDEKISQLTKKAELLAQYKKGVMQQIFSQEIRFKDVNGKNYPDWEEKKLGEVCEKKSSNISANSLTEETGDYKIYGATGLLRYVDFFREEDPYISIVKDGAGVGRILLCEAKSSVLGTLDILRPKGDNDINFLYSLLSNIRFDKYVTGSTIPHIYFKDYSKEKMLVPSLPEQNKIADFLSTIDKKISAVDQQLSLAKEWKKGLLQKMFV